MEREQQQQGIAAPFPAPPPFYKHFTKQDLKRLRQLRKEAETSLPRDESDAEGNNSLDILSLPPELRYLIPPPPPKDDKYRSFGQTIDLHAPEQTLEQAGIEQLYPSDGSAKLNPQPHLIALARSLLTTYLSLVGILSQNPVDYYEERVESLQTIMFNIHDLINQYRPHQARESLVLMMEDRRDTLREEIRRIQEAKRKVEEVMRTLKETEDGHALTEVTRGVHGSPGGQNVVLGECESRVRKQKSAWDAIESVQAKPP